MHVYAALGFVKLLTMSSQMVLTVAVELETVEGSIEIP